MNETQAPKKQSSGRRRFFKRAAIVTVIASLAAGIGLSAFARGGGHGGWHRGGGFMSMDPAQMDQRLDRMLKHLYVEIDATDAQKARLDPIVKQAMGDLMPLRQSMHEARQKAMALLTGDRVDREAIEALRAEQMQLADQASKRITQALADVAEVLTPEQKKEIAERMQRRHDRRGGPRGG